MRSHMAHQNGQMPRQIVEGNMRNDARDVEHAETARTAQDPHMDDQHCDDAGPDAR